MKQSQTCQSSVKKHIKDELLNLLHVSFMINQIIHQRYLKNNNNTWTAAAKYISRLKIYIEKESLTSSLVLDIWQSISETKTNTDETWCYKTLLLSHRAERLAAAEAYMPVDAYIPRIVVLWPQDYMSILLCNMALPSHAIAESQVMYCKLRCIETLVLNKILCTTYQICELSFSILLEE